MKLFHSAARPREAEALKAKVDPFGKRVSNNPVREVIAELRAMRDAGSLSDTDFAIEVAALLGASDLTDPPVAGSASSD